MSITRKLFVSAALLTVCHFQAGFSESYTGTQAGPRRPAQENSGAQIATDFSPEEIARISESFGNFIGRNLKTPAIQFDLEAILRGIRNGATGKPSPMTEQEYEQAMARLQQVAFKRLSEENLQAANTFMAQNAKKNGVVQIEPNKLQYLIVQRGNGQSVKEHGTPQLRYKGSFIDGTVFSNSDEVGGPISIPLDQTVPGFKRGLVGMQEGEKRIIYVHPDMGYGTTGQLPPNALLIFEIEIVKADATEAKPGQPHASASLSAKIPAVKSVASLDEDDDEDEDEEDDDERYAYDDEEDEESDEEIADASDEMPEEDDEDDDLDDEDDDSISGYYHRH